jgi:RNA polymerase sigma-70 factor, ECF subfamily
MHACATIPIERIVILAGDRPIDADLEAQLADCVPLAFRVAYSVLRQREDAEDVAQEALARAYRSIDALRDRERLRAWLVRISWRLAIDHQRAGRRRERRELAAAPLSPEPSVLEIAERNEFRERLWNAIDALPEKLRVVVVLSAIEGHDTGEVAALLELPPGTVKSRLHLARRRLAEALL